MAEDDFPIEAGHIMLFARAIGDPNPIYHDAEYAQSTEPGTVIAPPTFIQASRHFSEGGGARPRPGERWHGSGKQPAGSNAPEASDGDELPAGTAGRLHAEQHFEFHKPLVPGMVLHRVQVPGKEWEREGRRGGTLRFAENITEFYDQHDELVITTRGVVVRTSVTTPSGGSDQ